MTRRTRRPTRARLARRAPLGIRSWLSVAIVLALAASACSSKSAAESPPTSRSSTTTVTRAPRTTTTTTAPSNGRRLPAVPTTGAYLGTWRGPGPGRPENPMQNLAQAEAAIGRKYAIDHRYYDWGAALPSAYERWTVSQGRIPMVSLCACTFSNGASVPWASIASGAQDGYLTAIAKGFAALRSPAFFLFDAEPESNVGTRGTAADYVAAFRRVVEVFHAYDATNVAFVWATTAYSFLPSSHELALVESTYPGDGFVDWIASDPYNFDLNGAWRSLSDEVGPWYAWARAQHPTKPLAITEWGSKEDPNDPNRKAEWFRDALDALSSRYRAVRAVVYFDERKVEHGTVNDWRIDTSAASLAAFAQIAKASWLGAAA